jgi:stage III sporulation protein AB
MRIQLLRQLIMTVDMMECELQYRRTPLPQLFQKAADDCKGKLRRVFLLLSQELNAQISPNADRCMAVVLEKCGDLPGMIIDILRNMGTMMGRFDLEGQIRGLEVVRACCNEQLKEISRNIDARVRGYQTLGLCAGAAIAILLV